jgi:hypothetical protein
VELQALEDRPPAPGHPELFGPGGPSASAATGGSSRGSAGGPASGPPSPPPQP